MTPSSCSSRSCPVLRTLIIFICLCLCISTLVGSTLAFSTAFVSHKTIRSTLSYQNNKPPSSTQSSPITDFDEVPESFAFSYSTDAFSLENWEDSQNKQPTQTPTTTSTATAPTIKPRPKKPRVYKHLFRHYDDISFDSWLRCSDPQEFLESVGYTPSEVQALATSDAFWTLDVHDQLAPKIRFVVETLGGGTGRLTWKPDSLGSDPTGPEMEECSFNVNEMEIPHTLRLSAHAKDLIPSTFFDTSLSLDRVLGPHHAYLAHSDLPHGEQLLANPKLWQAFLLACKTNTFEKLCQEWESNFFPADQIIDHTPERIQNFEQAFAAGLIPASKHKPLDKDEMFYASPPNCISSEILIPLLLSHGANAFETDPKGASPLHWAAGNGNLPGVQSLFHSIWAERLPFSPHPPTQPPPLQCLQQQVVYEEDSQWHSPSNPMVVDILDEFREYKHGATPFHWACASVRSNYQDTRSDGSYDVCKYLLEQAGDRCTELANLPSTTAGNHPSTPIMWAAWAGNLPIVELLVDHGGDPFYLNPKSNQTAMHFAAASGRVEICEFLLSCVQQENDSERKLILEELLLNVPDIFDKTPLDYARENEHSEVVKWMMEKTLGSFLVKETSKGWFVPPELSTRKDSQKSV